LSFVEIFLYKEPHLLFAPYQRKLAIGNILHTKVFWDVAFDDDLLYSWAQIVEGNKRAQVSLRDFVLQAELGVGDFGGVLSADLQVFGLWPAISRDASSQNSRRV
jgi:hypothetical protein